MNVTKGPWDDVRQGGGDPPRDGGTGRRIDRLDRAVDQIAQDVTAIRVSIAKVETRMENAAAKTWVMSGAIAVLIALIGGFAWMAQQYLAPLLAAAGRNGVP
ncbi:hypothetical protein ACVWWJ_002860 [Luteibacter sp. HA06]|jgi:hypothetical protein